MRTQSGRAVMMLGMAGGMLLSLSGGILLGEYAVSGIHPVYAAGDAVSRPVQPDWTITEATGEAVFDPARSVRVVPGADVAVPMPEDRLSGELDLS